jgi:hypothetical protein
VIYRRDTHSRLYLNAVQFAAQNSCNFDRETVEVPVENTAQVTSDENQELNTVEPVYNYIGLCNISYIAPGVLWYQLISHY